MSRRTRLRLEPGEAPMPRTPTPARSGGKADRRAVLSRMLALLGSASARVPLACGGHLGGVAARTATVAASASGVLAGCAGAPIGAPPPVRRSGRFVLRLLEPSGQVLRTDSAAFELQGDDRQGELVLNGPLGTRLAQARWAPGLAELLTAEGTQTFDGLAALSRRLWDEDLPLQALPSWLAGTAWAGAPHRPLPGGGPGDIEQLGWSVRLARVGEGIVEWRREATAGRPGLQMRVRLDNPAP